MINGVIKQLSLCILMACATSTFTYAQPAEGTCLLSLSGVGGTLDLSGVYLPASQASSGGSAHTPSTAIPLTVTVKNSGTGSCPFVLTVPLPATGAPRYVRAQTSHTANANPDYTRIPYVIANGTHAVGGDVGATASGPAAMDGTQVVSGTVAPNSSVAIPLSVNLQSLSLVAYDEAPYQDSIIFSLYNGSFGAISGKAIPDTSMTVQVAVKPQMRMVFAPVGAAVLYKDKPDDYEISFGELAKGAERTMQVTLETNDGYELNFVSENAGKLVCKDHAGLKNAELKSVSYALYVGPSNTPYDLANVSASTFQSNLPTVPAGTLIQSLDARSSLPLKFLITGNPEESLAGRYEDVITVTFKNPN